MRRTVAATRASIARSCSGKIWPKQLAVNAVRLAGAPELELRCGAEPAVLRELLDAHFGGGPGVIEEFPLLLGAEHGGRSWLLLDGGRALAHAAWRPLALHCGPQRLAAAGIGLVTTHAAWRGRGLASALVAHCTQEAARAGAALALLFGEERGLYVRLGFAPAGRERRIELPARPAATALPPAPGRVRRATLADAPALHALLLAQPWRVERSAAQFAALLRVPRTHAYLIEREGRALAYCCTGKGRDLQGVLHEWAGEPAALRALVARVQQLEPGLRWLLAPAPALPPAEGPAALGPLLLARALHPEALGSDDPAHLLGAGERAGALEAYVWGLDSF
jgi:GNAT superfamily N-acetyltransferase